MNTASPTLANRLWPAASSNQLLRAALLAILGSALVAVSALLSIGTALLVHWLADAHQFQSMTLMLQKEVVDRLIARPRTKDYGRLSVLVQWLTEARRMFDVPPRAFLPPPKVTSSVVRLVPRARPLFPAKAEILERVTRAAFGQRRKMLRQSLRTLSSEPEALLATCAIAPTARAEELDVEQFCAIAWAIENGALTRE
jgi:16S rRNA (adenine1518-N6/adenine1519-N6)-dimethyltransferase